MKRPDAPPRDALATDSAGAPAEDRPPVQAARRFWLAGAAAAARTAGVAVSWWRQPGLDLPVDSTAPTASDDPLASLWAASFERPQGGELLMAGLRGRPLLINFWATWCPPCVRELPVLDQFAQAQRPKGWQVVGLAIDGPTAVREFLRRTPVGFDIGLAGLDGTALVRQLGNAQGGLPFSVLIDRRGQVVERHMGELKAEDLQRWAQRI